jgi:hypothetical protein
LRSWLFCVVFLTPSRTGNEHQLVRRAKIFYNATLEFRPRWWRRERERVRGGAVLFSCMAALLYENNSARERRGKTRRNLYRQQSSKLFCVHANWLGENGISPGCCNPPALYQNQPPAARYQRRKILFLKRKSQHFNLVSISKRTSARYLQTRAPPPFFAINICPLCTKNAYTHSTAFLLPYATIFIRT